MAAIVMRPKTPLRRFADQVTCSLQAFRQAQANATCAQVLVPARTWLGGEQGRLRARLARLCRLVRRGAATGCGLGAACCGFALRRAPGSIAAAGLPLP